MKLLHVYLFLMKVFLNVGKDYLSDTRMSDVNRRIGAFRHFRPFAKHFRVNRTGER